MSDEEKVSAVIDRLYQHEFMIDELTAASEIYSHSHIDYDYEAEEFLHRMNEVKDILNKRLMKDLKGILNMA